MSGPLTFRTRSDFVHCNGSLRVGRPGFLNGAIVIGPEPDAAELLAKIAHFSNNFTTIEVAQFPPRAKPAAKKCRAVTAISKVFWTHASVQQSIAARCLLSALPLHSTISTQVQIVRSCEWCFAAHAGSP